MVETLFKGFETGDEAFFNGQRVKMVRLARIEGKCTWRVRILAMESDNYGEMFDIPVNQLPSLEHASK